MLRYNFLFILTLLFHFSCTTNTSTDEEAEQAYQDLSSFVSGIEQDTAISEDVSEETWKEEAGALQEEYTKRKAGAAQFSDRYSAAQQEEIKDLEKRFDLAYEKRQKQFDDVSRRYRLRQDMLGVEVSTDDLVGITAEGITATYQKFVNTLENNKDQYTERDWEHIEGWWNALNNRKQELEAQLKPADRSMIQEKQEEYLSIRRSLN